ncbi:MAG: tubulin-like doman-containing protein [Acidobacteriota bacterium]
MSRKQKVVVEEMLTKPSAVSPMLFVGIGGCGCQMVIRVARHLNERPDYQDRYKDLVKFALIDTNINDLENHRELADETFLISDFEKEQYANLASGKLFLEEDPYFTQWVPSGYRFRAGDTAGAGQIRIESRLGVFYNMKHKDFVPRFRKLLEGLKSHEHGHRRLDTSEIRIILCYSVAGGTGSGSHLPIAYLLRDLASDMGKPWVIGVAVMPAVFEDKTGINKDGTYANGYAALKETEHLMKLGAPDSRFYNEKGITFHYNPADESKTIVRDRPFEFLYLIDKPESFSVREPVDAAADGLYLQFFSPLFKEQSGDYDNYTQHQRFLVPHDFETKGIVGFTTFYGSYGTAVLMVPASGLIDYCSRAAALSLMRANFLREIPGDVIYDAARVNRENFDEVTLFDEKNERPVHVSELHKKEESDRKALIDRLFMKRVQILAGCETEVGEAKRFLAMFRHGHRPGAVPRRGGGFEIERKQIRADLDRLTESRASFSINSLALPALAGEQPGQTPVLLTQAKEWIEEAAEEICQLNDGDYTPQTLRGIAAGWRDELVRRGRRVIEGGYKRGPLEFPGLKALIDFEFFDDAAAEVDLTSKRYAVLRLREDIDWNRMPKSANTDFELGDVDENRTVRNNDLPGFQNRLRNQAIERAFEDVERRFAERLGELKVRLDAYAEVQRTLDQGFEDFERDQSRRLQRLREEGDRAANRYVLDAEALALENGRRLWDFYYEDRVAGMSELSMSSRDIQRVLGEAVSQMSAIGAAGTRATLEKLYDELRRTANRVIQPRIDGDPRATDDARQDGLTLAEALELEVIYRALYLSNKAHIDREGHKAIREHIANYRGHVELQIDVSDPTHADYLRDKVKRLVKEKASLLCVYEESRDQHGGVRPNHVFLAAIDEDFKNSNIEHILRGADIPNLDWVTEGWHSPKEIIFYRAVLNVPLYVFGRLKDMQHEYHRFKSRTRRSKVLHIDNNWEEDGMLADLDPDSAKERHRQSKVRKNVINFAALLTTGPFEDRPDLNYIKRQKGAFALIDPGAAANDAAAASDNDLSPLGPSLTTAIEKLPETLEGERVKFLPYQQMLSGIRQGLSPKVLKAVTRLPFLWRRNCDELRNQYGSRIEPEQRLRLADYGDASERLREALDELLRHLRNRELEQRTMGDDQNLVVELPSDKAAEDLHQSVEILRTFSETWELMENPDKVSRVPNRFHWLFEPLGPDEFKEILDELRNALSRKGPGDDGDTEPATGSTDNGGDDNTSDGAVRKRRPRSRSRKASITDDPSTTST